MSLEGEIKDLNLSVDYDEFLACARYGDYEDVKEYLENVENMNILYQDKFGNTALHMASANGHKEICTLLLSHQQHKQGDSALLVNAENDQGNTPLHWASLNGRTAIVQLLLEYGADAKKTNKAGKTALHEAQQNSHEEVVSLLLERAGESAASQEAFSDGEENSHS